MKWLVNKNVTITSIIMYVEEEKVAHMSLELIMHLRFAGIVSCYTVVVYVNIKMEWFKNC